MKKLILMLTALAVLAAAGCSGDNGGPEVLEHLDIPEYIVVAGEQISTSETHLELDSTRLSNADIEPLRYMINLRSLRLGGPIDPPQELVTSEISDLSPLLSLPNLEQLDLLDLAGDPEMTLEQFLEIISNEQN